MEKSLGARVLLSGNGIRIASSEWNRADSNGKIDCHEALRNSRNDGKYWQIHAPLRHYIAKYPNHANLNDG